MKRKTTTRRTLGATDFKIHCLSLLARVAATGTTIVVTKRGKPIAELRAVAKRLETLQGAFKGRVRIHGDLAKFGFVDEWESAR